MLEQANSPRTQDERLHLQTRLTLRFNLTSGFNRNIQKSAYKTLFWHENDLIFEFRLDLNGYMLLVGVTLNNT